MKRQEVFLLQFSLLGAPKIVHNGKAVDGFVTRKAEALLFYLAVTGRPHTRSTLATMFWPDMPEQNARKNLRDVIASVRKTVGDAILISHQTLAFDSERPLWVDVTILSNVLTNPKAAALDDLREAIGLYHGEFLEGFHILNAFPFDEWVRQKREEYHILVLNGLHALADRYAAAGEFEAGLTATRRLLLLDQWNEEAHRKQMLLLVGSGQRSAAMAQYQTCVQVLADELQVEPLPETTLLYNQIRDGRLNNRLPNLQDALHSKEESAGTSVISAPTPTSTPHMSPHNLSRQLTPILGRTHECVAVRNKLFDPNYPLVTIVGEGGIGKTRLALAVAQSIASSALTSPLSGAGGKPYWPSMMATPSGSMWEGQTQFDHGVWFVPLADSVPTRDVPEQLAGIIGATLNLNFAGNQPLTTQLLEWLAQKSILLVLDNFEHLSAGVGFLVNLLQNAHHLKLLVTSRHRLNLQAEYVYRLDGLAVPDSAESGLWNHTSLLDYGSIQLFIERAERTTPGFTLTAKNQADVLAIAQFVEGLPLGIELAAALVEHHDVAVIAETLLKDYAWLAADLTDLPERHRSIRSVLAYSWDLLTDQEAQILAQCSVFNGSFTVEAVTTITGATITLLEALMNQSLVRCGEAGRLEMHELVRQHARERLHTMPAVKDAVAHQHCTYYVDLLYTNQEHLSDNHAISAAMRLELGNVRAAWIWALTTANAEAISRGLDGFVRCYEMAGLYKEGESYLRQAVNAFQGQSTSDGTGAATRQRLLARLYIEQGLFCLNLGWLDKAEQLYQRAVEAGERLADTFLLAYAQLRMSLLMLARGNYKAALAVGQAARHWAQSGGFAALEGRILDNIGSAYNRRGDYTQAHTCFEQALQLTKRHGSKESEALLLMNLGELNQQEGNIAKALHCHQQALYLLRPIDNQQRIAMALQYLGTLWIRVGAFAQARIQLEQALEIFQQIGDRYFEELILTKLCNLFHQLTLYERAQTYGKQAVRMAEEAGHKGILAEALLYSGRTLTALGRLPQAAEAYQQALQLWEESGEQNWALAAQAELAQLACLHNDPIDALTKVNKILSTRATLTINFLTDPLHVAWLCYRVLEANHDLRAHVVLQEASHQLQMQAATIDDEELQQSFLKNVPINQTILQAIQAQATDNRIMMRINHSPCKAACPTLAREKSFSASPQN